MKTKTFFTIDNDDFLEKSAGTCFIEILRREMKEKFRREKIFIKTSLKKKLNCVIWLWIFNIKLEQKFEVITVRNYWKTIDERKQFLIIALLTVGCFKVMINTLVHSDKLFKYIFVDTSDLECQQILSYFRTVANSLNHYLWGTSLQGRMRLWRTASTSMTAVLKDLVWFIGVDSAWLSPSTMFGTEPLQ